MINDIVEQPISSATRANDAPDGLYNTTTTIPSKVPEIAQMWASYGGRFQACERAVATLEPGQYNIHHTDSGITFVKHVINTDRLFVLPDSASEEIILGIEQFWTKKEHFRQLKFMWKRGILLHGGQGSGKTSTVQQISQSMINRGGISFYVDDPGLGAAGLQIFRKIEPDRPILVMLEDLDAIIKTHGESILLSLLDGELQIDNVVFIATTNYPEDLDKRLINRPSRFDVVKHIDVPTADARSAYLSNISTILNNDPIKLKKWVLATDRYSIAHLKELLISVEVFEIPFDETITRLNKMFDVNVTSGKDNRTEFGFSGK